MSRQVILFAIAFLLILTFAFAQENQDSSNQPPRPKPDGSMMPPRPLPSGLPPRPQDSSNMPPQRPHQFGNLPPKKQQQEGNQKSQANTESAQDNENGDKPSRQQGGFPFGLILAIVGGLIVIVSLSLACGAGITVIILRKKGYSLSIQKNESSHQRLNEEEVPSQYMAQVPIIYSTTPVVHYPNISQQV